LDQETFNSDCLATPCYNIKLLGAYIHNLHKGNVTLHITSSVIKFLI
jgi:hypothetical protein